MSWVPHFDLRLFPALRAKPQYGAIQLQLGIEVNLRLTAICRVLVRRDRCLEALQGARNAKQLARGHKSGYTTSKFLIVLNKGGPARTRSFLLPGDQTNNRSARQAKDRLAGTLQHFLSAAGFGP